MEKQMQVTLSPDVYSETEKLRAAYALNMCNVSVSQIVDYKDAYILDQEYDAILNNLNLEQIPKDDALLRILVELLNSITFFRIQDKKKACIEQEYQTKTKAAIWSAIPSLSMIVASGNPIVIAYSLATQVGIGYMNYRKEKARTSSEKSERETELEITAIEQFNALRRELFTTAWRLADKYQFPDRYRLTEKQISQYNAILMDGNEMRKYARMEAIQDKFEAYPQFWYQMGHTAAYIAQSDEFVLEEEDRAFYKQKAVGLFEKFFDLNRFNILREDHIAASAALEYVDLLLPEAPGDPEVKKNVLKRLDETIGMVGNANDILQLYAISYLKCGGIERACKLLKYLVNEEYNTLTNAKLLSRLYASGFRASRPNEQNRIRSEYKMLTLRVNPQYLFPLPKTVEYRDALLVDEYMQQQKTILTSEYRSTVKMYAKKFNSIYQKMDDNVRNTLSLYGAAMDSAQTLKPKTKDERMVDLLEETVEGLDALSLFSNMSNKYLFVDSIRSRIYSCIKGQGISSKSYQGYTGEFFRNLATFFSKTIQSMTTASELENASLELYAFCIKEQLQLPVQKYQFKHELEIKPSGTEFKYFDYKKIIEKDRNVYNTPAQRKKVEEAVFNGNTSSLIDNAVGDTKLYTRGTKGFEDYFKENGLHKWKPEVLLVIDDTTKRDCDLWLTYDGIALVYKNDVGKVVPYSEVQRAKKDSEKTSPYLELDWPDIYENPRVDFYYLDKIISKLKEISNQEKR